MPSIVDWGIYKLHISPMTVSRPGAVKKYLKAIFSAQNYIPSSLMSGDG